MTEGENTGVYVKKNKQGGLDQTDETSLERAKEADLITLPANVPGTNCSNCMYAQPRKSNMADFWCVHAEVNLPITPRMCCKFWDNKGVKRPWD